MAWDEVRLARIVDADDLKVSPLRADGVTHGTPTWIWAVSVGGELYVRPHNGQRSRWYQSALARPEGRIVAVGETFDVSFEPAPADLEGVVTSAYKAKYRDSPYLPPMIAQGPASATMRISPRV